MSEDLLPKAETPVKQNFNFVDTIRCISMIGIVYEHATVLWGVKYQKTSDLWVQVFAMQFWKFATIAFFLIGGFLINYKFAEYTPAQYITRRFKNTIKPWLFWICILMLSTLIHRYVIYAKGGDPVFTNGVFNYFIEELRYILFESSFWFILNFLICISLLLIFKKYLYKLWFGGILLLISLVYSFNLYYEWFVTHHSAALFGFVFYLWLGVNMNIHFNKVMSLVKRINWPLLITINLLLLIISSQEAIYLFEHGSKDQYNTLRISNILYSLTMFLLLLKLGRINFIDKVLLPRQSTFGIYLLHQILIILLLPEIFKFNQWNFTTFSIWQNIGYSAVRFLIVYLISFIITRLLLKTRMKWTVGG